MTRIILAAAMTAAVTGGVLGQGVATNPLPLENQGLEHLDIIVPDPGASARFYMRLFRSALHQQPVRDTLRYFVLLGDLPADRQVGYIAIGAAGGRAPAIGHYCVLTTVYDRAAMANALQAAGYGVAGPGPTGMWPDPDGLELQLFQPPAGLVTAAVPSPLPIERDGFLVPRGVDHVLLRVSSLARSLPYLPAGVRRRGRTAPRLERTCLVSPGAGDPSRAGGGVGTGARNRTLRHRRGAVRWPRARDSAARPGRRRIAGARRARRRPFY